MHTALLSSPRISGQEIDDAPVGLFLSPHLCLLSKSESQCNIKIEARWKTKEMGDFCLVIAEQIKPLACWRETQFSRHTFSLNITKSTTIYLIEEKSKTELFEHPVRIQKQVSQYRKKRRNPWQFY